MGKTIARPLFTMKYSWPAWFPDTAQIVSLWSNEERHSRSRGRLWKSSWRVASDYVSAGCFFNASLGWGASSSLQLDRSSLITEQNL
jgi:hypothetical protein